jgi:dATP pyrophosphohydrolase
MTAQYKIPESVLVVIHTADLQVLLIERADRPGFWQSVTGSKDVEDELLLETAVREVGEETGIIVQSSVSVPPAIPWTAQDAQPSAIVPLENLSCVAASLCARRDA